MKIPKLAEYKEQYGLNLKLAIPVVLTQAGQVTVQLVDNAMVGRMGAVPLAGVAFGGTVFWGLFILCMGITLGLTPLVGEMYAKGNHRISAGYLQNSLLLYTIIGLVILGLFNAITPLMHHMGQPSEAVEQAIPYYKYLVWSVIPFMLYAAFKQFLEGVGNTTITMVIVIVSNVVNIFLNYLLIYGNWGFPEMGAAGAGLATLIARSLAPVLMIIYFVSKTQYKRYLKFFNWDKFRLDRVRSLMKVGTPISMQMFLENGAFVLTSIMMGWLGTAAIAANQITVIVANFAFMIIIGISSATTIRVSHEYGNGNLKRLKMAADSAYHIGLVWNIFAAIAFIALRNYLPRIFTSDAEVITIASNLLIFLAAFQLTDGLQAISIGILRGMQDVKSLMWISFFSYIVINLPIGYICAFKMGWGPGGLWASFIFGITTAAILLITRFRKRYAALLRQSRT